jgi:hypothetical protein
MLLAVIGARSIYISAGPESMQGLRYRLENSEARLQEMESFIPADAVVYSSNQDKVLWWKWDIGLIPGEAEGVTGRQLGRAADSIARVAAYDRPVYVIRRGQMSDGEFRTLDGLLNDRRLDLALSGPADLGVYEVVPLRSSTRIPTVGE